MKNIPRENNFLDYDDFANKVSVRMQQYRLKAKLSQRDIANIIGVSKTYISNIERGKTKIPAYILNAYCYILHISPDTLLNYTYGEKDLETDILKNLEQLSPYQKETIRTMVKVLAEENQKKMSPGN